MAKNKQSKVKDTKELNTENEDREIPQNQNRLQKIFFVILMIACLALALMAFNSQNIVYIIKLTIIELI